MALKSAYFRLCFVAFVPILAIPYRAAKFETVRIWAPTGRLCSEKYVALLLLLLGRRISFSLHA
jgi:hypothetical protein